MLFLPTKSSLLGSMSGGISFGISAMESVTTMVLVGTWKNVASLRPTSRPPSAKDPDLRILTSISSSHGGVFPAPPPTAASPSTPVGALPYIRSADTSTGNANCPGAIHRSASGHRSHASFANILCSSA